MIKKKKTQPLINVSRALIRGLKNNLTYPFADKNGNKVYKSPSVKITQNVDQYLSAFLNQSLEEQRSPSLPAIVISLPGTRKSSGDYNDQSQMEELADASEKPAFGLVARPPVFKDVFFQFQILSENSITHTHLVSEMSMIFSDSLAELNVYDPENDRQECYEAMLADEITPDPITGNNSLYLSSGEITVCGVEMQFNYWEQVYTVQDFKVFGVGINEKASSDSTGNFIIE